MHRRVIPRFSFEKGRGIVGWIKGIQARNHRNTCLNMAQNFMAPLNTGNYFEQPLNITGQFATGEEVLLFSKSFRPKVGRSQDPVQWLPTASYPG
jgi:hypothetical protein